MSAQVYTPASGASGQRSALIVLHGCAQTAQNLRDRSSFDVAAEEHAMVVALPDVPGGGVLMGCWDYYGQSHTRQGHHEGPVLALVENLLSDSLGIDPNRVFLAGLSSGGGMTLVLGCLAPDVFAGLGVVAGPAVGTQAGDIGMVTTSAAQAGQTCQRLAGSASSSFASQQAVIVAGTSDYTVNQGYAPLNAEMLATIYGVSATEELDVATIAGYQPAGHGQIWSEPSGRRRVALVQVDGMGHAWPAGTGPGPEISFVATEGPHLADFLARFFDGEGTLARSGPRVESLVATAQGAEVVVSGQARAPSEGSVSHITVTLSSEMSEDSAQVDVDDSLGFSATFGPLATGFWYTARAEAVDAAGAVSAPVQASAVYVGNRRDGGTEGDLVLDEPEAAEGCLLLSGSVGPATTGAALTLDPHGRSVDLTIEDNGAFDLEVCNPTVGCQQAILEVTGAEGEVGYLCTHPFEVSWDGAAPAAVEGTLLEHASRFGMYPHGYGVADASYAELFSAHGAMEPFPLYEGPDGAWYANAQSVAAASLTVSSSCSGGDEALSECPGQVVGSDADNANDGAGCSCSAAEPGRARGGLLILLVGVAATRVFPRLPRRRPSRSASKTF